MANAANSALAGLLKSNTGAPGGSSSPRQGSPQAAPAPTAAGVPPAPQEGTSPSGGSAIGPASEEALVRFSLPPGTLEIRVSPDDPAFEPVAAQAVSEGRQIVRLEDKVFALPQQQQQPSAAQGLLAGAVGSGQGNAQGAVPGGLLA